MTGGILPKLHINLPFTFNVSHCSVGDIERWLWGRHGETGQKTVSKHVSFKTKSVQLGEKCTFVLCLPESTSAVAFVRSYSKVPAVSQGCPLTGVMFLPPATTCSLQNDNPPTMQDTSRVSTVIAKIGTWRCYCPDRQVADANSFCT